MDAHKLACLDNIAAAILWQALAELILAYKAKESVQTLKAAPCHLTTLVCSYHNMEPRAVWCKHAVQLVFLAVLFVCKTSFLLALLLEIKSQFTAHGDLSLGCVQYNALALKCFLIVQSPWMHSN